VSTQYRCANERRRQAVRDSAAINGIDYLEVAADQRTLHVHFFHDLPTSDQELVDGLSERLMRAE